MAKSKTDYPLCPCGSMLLPTTAQVYGPYRSVYCDKCDENISSDAIIYHCFNEEGSEHPNGFDFCQKCFDGSNDKDNYLQRIKKIMKIEESVRNNSNVDYYEMVCKEYGQSANFLNDYHSLIQNLDNDKSYLKSQGKCPSKDCQYLHRNFDRRQYEKYQFKDGKSMVIRQIFDQIHTVSYHLSDIGHRNYENEEKRGYNSQKWMKMTKNKFMTQIRNGDNERNYLKYREGFAFFYHPYFKNFMFPNVRIGRKGDSKLSLMEYGNGQRMDQCNRDRPLKGWFISPKFKSVKEELLKSKVAPLTMEQYDNAMNKAIMKLESLYAKSLSSNGIFEVIYGIKAGSPITEQHVLSIMIYTNYDSLSTAFSMTYRKNSANESDGSLKQRHAAFAHLARFIKESVDCFGNDDAIKLYHGISEPALFESFQAKFISPTSMTHSWAVATNFATNSGTVITVLTEGRPGQLYFDCRCFSDFPSEDERLFVGTRDRVNVIEVMDTRSTLSFGSWIECIRIFYKAMVVGEYLDGPISDLQSSRISKLVNDVLNDNSDAHIPEYVSASFKYMLRNVRKIHINLVMNGARTLRNLYLNRMNSIKWDTIRCLYPSLMSITIQNLQHISNTNVLYSRSVMINEELLACIYSFLQRAKYKEMLIYIVYPLNQIEQLKLLVTAFESEFERIGYCLRVNRHADAWLLNPNATNEKALHLLTIDNF